MFAASVFIAEHRLCQLRCHRIHLFICLFAILAINQLNAQNLV